jgi:hypothetical protein
MGARMARGVVERSQGGARDSSCSSLAAAGAPRRARRRPAHVPPMHVHREACLLTLIIPSLLLPAARIAMEQQSNPSGSASAGPSKRASSTSASPTKRPRLASASSRVLALQASSSFSLALASSSPSPQWHASFLFLPTSSGILLVHPLRREQRHLLPLAAPRFFCVAPRADAVFAANERGAKVWTRAPATQCGNAWTEHALPTSSVRGGGVKEARWCGEPGKVCSFVASLCFSRRGERLM